MQDQVLSDKLSSLKEKIEGELKQLKSSKELYEFKNLYLEGKKSKISELMKEMGKLAPEERAGYGKSVNDLKSWAFDRFADMEDKMKKLELMHRYEREKIDLTIPAQPVKIGNLHPVTLVRNQLIDIFAGMGFEIYEGSEIVWARKTEVENNSVVELIYLQEGANCEQFNRFVDFFKANCEREIHGENVEKFLTENEFEIDEYMNFFEYDPAHPAQTFLEYAKENGIGITYVKVDDDFGHVAQTVGTESPFDSNLNLISESFPEKFVNLLSTFFFQPYFCEAKIDQLEERKLELEKLAKTQSYQERLENKTDTKIVNCLKSIAAYQNDLNYFNQKYGEREMAKTEKFLNELEQKYNLGQEQ